MAFRSGSRHFPNSSGTSVVVPVPPGAQVGDIVVVHLYKESTSAVTIPSGFTEAFSNTASATTQSAMHIYWKRLTAVDTGSYTFSWTGSVWRSAMAHAYSGRIATGDPFSDFTSGSGTTGTSLTITGPTLLDGDDVYAGWQDYGGVSQSTHTATGLTFQQITDDAMSFSGDNFSAGPMGSVTFTQGTNGGGKKAFIGGLKAAAASSTPVSTTENVTLSASESTTLASSSSRTDSVALSASESVALASTSAVTDSVALSISESDTINIFRTIAVDDSVTLSVTDTSIAAIHRDIAVNDAATLSVSETIAESIVNAISVTDSATLSVSESVASTIFRAIQVSDSATISIVDSTATSVSLSRTDAVTLSASDTLATAVRVVVNDATTLSADDTLDILNLLNITDGAVLSVSDHAVAGELGVIPARWFIIEDGVPVEIEPIGFIQDGLIPLQFIRQV